ncbi:hypothetical protein FOZ61_009868 [Perkinsus olseni]|uniref:Uncharacterized protein n=1 Tax=Perkinsus olseni TaxID=32597 RepID=A0A7J6KXX7_PEROL|nr:hypothetical protein FOZ61_009868 [Perkinsus olseni]
MSLRMGSLEGHSCAVTALEVIGSLSHHSGRESGNDDSQCLSADMGGTVRLWNIGGRQCLQTFNAAHGLLKGVDDGPVDPRCLVFITPDLVAIAGRRLLFFCRDETRLSATCDAPIPPQAVAINGRLGHVVLVADRDTIVWDALTGRRLLVFTEAAPSPISAMCMERCDERLIVLGTDTGSLIVYNYAVMAKVKALRSHARAISNISWLGQRIFSLCAGRQLIIHDASTITDNDGSQPAAVLKVLDLGASNTAAIDYLLQGRQVAYGTDEGMISWYRIDSGKLERCRAAPRAPGEGRSNGICLVSYMGGSPSSDQQVSATLTLSVAGITTLFGLLPMERFEPRQSWRFAWSSTADSKTPTVVSKDDNEPFMMISAATVGEENLSAVNCSPSVRRTMTQSDEGVPASSPAHSMKSSMSMRAASRTKRVLFIASKCGAVMKWDCTDAVDWIAESASELPYASPSRPGTGYSTSEPLSLEALQQSVRLEWSSIVPNRVKAERLLVYPSQGMNILFTLSNGDHTLRLWDSVSGDLIGELRQSGPAADHWCLPPELTMTALQRDAIEQKARSQGAARAASGHSPAAAPFLGVHTRVAGTAKTTRRTKPRFAVDAVPVSPEDFLEEEQGPLEGGVTRPQRFDPLTVQAADRLAAALNSLKGM